MEKLKILGGILKRINNFNGKMSPFGERLILQKTIYLMQAFGLNIGYIFSWYIHGPYSIQLTRDGYEMINTYDKFEEIEFNEEDEAKFSEFIEFLGDKKENPEWLEVVASIHVLKKIQPEKSKDEIIRSVMQKQPECFTKEMCLEAWEHLEEYGLI